MKGRNKENTDFENDRLGNPQNGTRLPKMKKYSILLLLIAFFMSCKNVRQVPPIVYFEGDIDSVRLVYEHLYPGLYYEDELPEHFLRRGCVSRTISDTDTLAIFQDLLQKSVFVKQDSDMTFDTNIVALIDYQDGHTDTLGMSVNLRRGFIRGYQKFQNPELIDSVINAIAYRDSLRAKIYKSLYWKGDYKCPYAPNMCKQGERVYSDADYGFFRGTEAETLARNMYLENYDSIELIIKQNPELMYCRDEIKGVPIFNHCIYFQQDTVAKLFLENGYNVNFYYEEEDTLRSWNNKYTSCWAYAPPLICACADSYYNDCSLLLILYGADVNFRLPGGYTPLMRAVGDNYEMAKVLIDLGAKVNVCKTILYAEDLEHVDENTVFIEEREYLIDWVRKKDYFKMMHLLLTHGANIDTPYSRRVGDFRSYIESVNPEELTSADRRYLQKIKNYLKELDSEKKEGAENDLR